MAVFACFVTVNEGSLRCERVRDVGCMSRCRGEEGWRTVIVSLGIGRTEYSTCHIIWCLGGGTKETRNTYARFGGVGSLCRHLRRQRMVVPRIGRRTCEIRRRSERRAHGWERVSERWGMPCVGGQSFLQLLLVGRKGQSGRLETRWGIRNHQSFPNQSGRKPSSHDHP